jgi:hypothetical protein
MTQHKLWALIVTIEEYKTRDHKSLPGAHKDGDDTTKYLQECLNVPESHILHLRDHEASRNGIISAFHTHLIDNPNIAKGDAILFHYSGHGSFMPAPPGWTVVEEKTGDATKDNMVEVIIPHDEGLPDPKTGNPICGIPDRTLAALINKAAIKYGNNITIVLDCCSSGHGTREGREAGDTGDLDDEELVVRAIDPKSLAPLQGDLDEELLARSLPERPKERRGRIKALAADHVLMAACGPREQARGGKNGGIFTRLWLKNLRRNNVYPRTYAQILAGIEASISQMNKSGQIHIQQHPQCDGIVRDRLVFEETMARGDYFDAVRGQVEARNGAMVNMLTISAGEVQGIEPKTLFEIHIMDKKLQSERILGTAIVREVNATTCVAELQLAQDTTLTQRKYTAIVSQPPERLIYEIQNGAPDSVNTQNSLRLFRQSLAKLPSKYAGTLHEAANGASPDLRLCFNEDGSITFYRLDPIIGALRNAHPHLTPKEVRKANFGDILYGIARFNRMLAWSSKTHPVAGDITFDMCPLTKSDDFAYEDFSLRELGPAVDIVEDEMTIVYREDAEDEYALVLSNKTSQNLHVEIWFFDPNTYKIELCYKSANPKKATLHGDGSTLQIGGSTERGDPLEFYLPGSTTSDTLFLKAFITDQDTSLRFLKQSDLIGEDSDGRKVLLQGEYDRVGHGEIVTKGMWDTIVRKVTVVDPSVC